MGLSGLISSCFAQLGLAVLIQWKSYSTSIVMESCICCRVGCAIVRLCRLWSVRNPDKMAKKAIVSSNASCVKEWLISCFLKGPFLSEVALGSVDRQWGSGTC